MTFLPQLIRALRCAIRGFAILLRTQRNVRIQLVAAIAVIVAGAACGLMAGEWIALVLCIGLVLAAEAANTALESLADAVHPDQHPLIGRAKDVAAAGVLITSIAAAVVGAIVFGPRLIAA
jgi:diacylglycerol kinase (ATP)